MSRDPVRSGHGPPLTAASLLIFFLGSLIISLDLALPPTGTTLHEHRHPLPSFPSLLLAQISACLSLRDP